MISKGICLFLAGAFIPILQLCTMTLDETVGSDATTRVVPSGMGPAIEKEILMQFLRDGKSRRPTREEIDKRFAEDSIYQGTFLEQKPTEDREVFLSIAFAFFDADLCPRERSDIFAHECNFGNLSVVAWNGRVKSISPTERGIYNVVVDIRPELVARGGGVAFSTYQSTEHWTWDGDTLRFDRLEKMSQKFNAVFVD